jgi:hypothetical protein
LGSTNTDSFPSISGFIMLMITTWRMHSLYVCELFFSTKFGSDAYGQSNVSCAGNFSA